MLPVLTVSQFIEQINGIVAGEFLIEGEVSQYKVSQGKWIFFDLKDEQAVVGCFATTFGLRVPLEDGMKIRVLGYPKIHEKSGRFSFTVQKAEVLGEGSLKRAYELLKRKLEAEGLFAPERKRALPRLPESIGVIASRDSAAFGDFVRILNNRWSGLEVRLYHVTVQGESAVGEIASAFDFFNRTENKPAVLALVRGGGSLEDLSAFNSEEVVRAVYGSKIPVICGVGHERDESLADFAADVRASTPSNAAEMLVPDRRDFANELDFSLENIAGNLEYGLTHWRRAVEQNFYLISGRFEQPLSDSRLLIQKFGNLLTGLQNNLFQQKSFVSACERLFNNVSPRRVLERGYSITRDAHGRILRSSEQVDAGDKIVVELKRGMIKGEVKSVGPTK